MTLPRWASSCTRFVLGAAPLLAACAGAPSSVEPPSAAVVTMTLPTASAAPTAGPRSRVSPDASAPASVAPPTVVETSAPAPGPAPPAAPSITLAGTIACELDGARLQTAPGGAELRFRVGGPMFARVAGAHGHLALPLGPASQGALLEVIDAGLSIRGIIDAGAVVLHANAPMVLGEVAIPEGMAPLEWLDVSARGVTVRLGPIAGVTPIQPLSAAVPCSALALDRGTFDSGSYDSARGVPGVRQPPRRALLRAGAAVALAAKPGGATLATLAGKDEIDAEVQVIGVNGKSSRILWWRRGALIFGWVASADLLVPTNPGGGFGFGSGTGGGFARSVHPVSRAVCADALPVVAEASGERVTVGIIAAGTVIDRMDRGAVETEVWVRTSAVQLAPGARLLVPTARLARCAPRDL